MGGATGAPSPTMENPLGFPQWALFYYYNRTPKTPPNGA